MTWSNTSPDVQAQWQRRSVAVLADLIDRGAAAGLPALWWTLAGVGASLVGQVLDRTTDPRATFEGWAALIGATPSPEQRFDTGRTQLGAIAGRVGGVVTVAISADVWDTPPRAGSLAGRLPNGEPCAYARRHGTDDWHEHDHTECQDAAADQADDHGDNGHGGWR